MKTVHIGHHFYGSGNVGDDFMMAGFLRGLNHTSINLTCCVPYPRDTLIRRFPKITWLPYSPETRARAISEADLWLGLGGSPFQSTVSTWFEDHLTEEASLCTKYQKPMVFLGIGGQENEAYKRPKLHAVIAQADYFWVRDTISYNTLISNGISKDKVSLKADLAHLFFKSQTFPKLCPSRLSTALNFDYKEWKNLNRVILSLEALKPVEQIWLSQELRKLPGAEQDLYEQLSPEQQVKWRLQLIDKPQNSLESIITHWPSSEWVISSRFHTTLAAAWAGSKAVVIDINTKLGAVAEECGYQALSPESDPSQFLEALVNAKAPKRELLSQKADLAQASVTEFITLLNR